MKYPEVIDEYATLRLMLMGRSIARFGDGEWRCATGGGCTSQRADPKLAAELRQVLNELGDGFIVGIPKVDGCPRAESWAKYCASPYLDLLPKKKPVFHSSFITRPDNAPSIDTPEYWELVRGLWRDRDVVLVVGSSRDGSPGPEKKSLTLEMLEADGARVAQVIGPRQHAYADVDKLMREIHLAAGESTSVRILLCLGTAATVLAWRLWKEGYHALDVGHIGMFMRHAGAYRYAADDLTSQEYRRQLVGLHESRTWGADGAKHADAVLELFEAYQPKTTLDYGCGENKLAEALKDVFRISGYDPGIPDRAKMPKPCDMLICTDVLEHVEPSKLDAVLDHIWRLTGRVAYFVIDVKPANAVLPDGRNAHLSLHAPEWWVGRLTRIGWSIDVPRRTGKSVAIIAEKPQ